MVANKLQYGWDYELLYVETDALFPLEKYLFLY